MKVMTSVTALVALVGGLSSLLLFVFSAMSGLTYAVMHINSPDSLGVTAAIYANVLAVMFFSTGSLALCVKILSEVVDHESKNAR